MIPYQRLRHDREYRIITLATFGLIFNFLYAFYHGILGITNHSMWFIASCFYYLLLGIMKYFAVIGNRHKNMTKEYFFMKFTGFLFSGLSFILAVIIYISLSQKIAAEYDTITMLTIATYTFTKITLAMIKFIKHHKNITPHIHVIQNISYAEVAVSVFTMQRSMLASFGDMNNTESVILNILTGTAIWLFTLTLGIIMIKNSKKKGLPSWQNQK